MSGFGILGTNRPTIDDIADVLEAGAGTTDLARAARTISVAPTAIALREVTPASAQTAETGGYYAVGDGGAARYRGVYGAASGSYVDNGGTVLVPTGGNGSAAWVMIPENGEVSVLQFGATLGAAGDRAANTAALDKALLACTSDNASDIVTLVFPGFVFCDGVRITKQFVSMRGTGMWNSGIDFGSSPAGVRAATMPYMRPFIADMGIVGSSGVALDLDAVAIQVYGGTIERIHVQSGSDGLRALHCFSTMFHHVWSASAYGHSFRIGCGPGVHFDECYALTCGAGKAGYRLTGDLVLTACNGLNDGDWWGVFGQDSTAADGFQDDFPGAGTVYFDAQMRGCNVEHFASRTPAGGGIKAHSLWGNFKFDGGKVDRYDLSTPYAGLFVFQQPSRFPRNPAILSPGSVYLGGGTPTPAAISTAGGARARDESYALSSVGVTTIFDVTDNLSYPLLTHRAVSDVYAGLAHDFNAVSSPRVTCGILNYNETTITATPATVDSPAQVITNVSRVLLAPTAPTSYSRFAYSTAVGAAGNLSRNGELILVATVTGITLFHNYGAAFGMRLAGGINRVLALGDVVRLVWSPQYLPGQGGWVEA